MNKAGLIPSLACFALLASCGGETNHAPQIEEEGKDIVSELPPMEEIDYKPRPYKYRKSDELRFSNFCPDREKLYCPPP